jgi:PAS domain S-box-containing protein
MVDADAVFAGDGEMHARCRALDWSTTPLGPVAGWSQSLRTTAGIVLNSRNPMFLFWGPELIQIYNDAYRPSLGHGGRHPRALGMRGEDFWTDIWSVIGPQIAQVMTTAEATWHEDQYIPIERNGRLEDVWWTYSYSPVRDDDGSIGGTLVVCLETTNRVVADRERERAEAARKESQERLRAIYDGTYEYIGLITPDGTVLDCNRASLEFAGNAREDVVGLPFWETPWFTHTPGAPELLRGWVARAAAGEFIRCEAPLRRPSGTVMTFDFSLHPIRNERGEVVLIVPEGRDISERERLMLELRVERARLAYVFRQAPSFLAVLRGPDHVFELVNDAYYQLVGHRELVGKPAFQALPELRDQQFRELLDRVLRTGEPFVGRELPLSVARTTGAPPEERFIDLTYLPLVESDGSRSGIIAHGTDVTEQVRARRQVERLLRESETARADAELARADAEIARAESEAANRAKSDFLAVMSHELRTPLNAIGGYAELLEMGLRGPLTAPQREDLRRIQTSQRHLLGLINEVLNYAKLETGTVHYDIEDVRVREALSVAEALVAPQARAKGLQLAVADAPPALAARADAEKLRQILVNLLSNAVKFTNRGGRVDLACEAHGEQVRVIVRDTGVGIPADKLEAVFEPFVQVRADFTRTADGTGLGLAISRDLARGMKGDLSAESTLGVGSTFTLTLPRA